MTTTMQNIIEKFECGEELTAEEAEQLEQHELEMEAYDKAAEYYEAKQDYMQNEGAYL